MNTYDTPGEYPLTLSKGSYIFEAWGAQGGSCNIGDYIPSGGFVNYTLSLDYETELNIYIGGKGSTSINGYAQGGTNGGGNGWVGEGTCNLGCAGGGGGATYVYLNKSILIFVAAGGGGDALARPYVCKIGDVTYTLSTTYSFKAYLDLLLNGVS